MLQHEPYRPLAHLRRIPLVLRHRLILSRDQASKIPGAVQTSFRRAA
jgi:hypothetical protein